MKKKKVLCPICSLKLIAPDWQNMCADCEDKMDMLAEGYSLTDDGKFPDPKEKKEEDPTKSNINKSIE